MKKHGFIKILTENQCKSVIKDIEDLSEHWIRRENKPIDFYTLGAVSYQEGMQNDEEYIQRIKDMNPILKQKFGWIYDIILQKLSEIIGPCELIDSLAYPGFHIIGHLPNQPNDQISRIRAKLPLTSIHQDRPYAAKQALKVWSTFKDVKVDHTISWTLSIESPKCGSGLATWDNKAMKQYEYNKEFVDYVKNLKDYEDFIDHAPPTAVVTYKTGEIFFFHGLMFHQISPCPEVDEYDRRITMQGHGIMCDGIWRIYF